MNNIVTNVYAKFDDDLLCNEKALVDGKSDNKNPNNNNKQLWQLCWCCVAIKLGDVAYIGLH